MKLKSHLLGFGLLGILAAVAVGAIGFLATQRQAHTLQTVLTAGEAQQRAMNADMMHDAIRADVLAITLARGQGDEAGLKAAEKEMAEHGKTFREDFAALGAIGLAPALMETLTGLQPLLDTYLREADRVLRIAHAADARELPQALGEFRKVFGEFEERMGQFDDAILEHAQQATVQAQAAATQSNVLLAVALVLAVLGVTASALWLSAHLVRPLEAAMGVAQRIADGDLSKPVHADARVHEFGQLMATLDHMQTQLRDITAKVRRRAETVAAASSQVNSASETLIENTQVHAATMGNSTEALQRISAEIHNNLRQTQQANQLAEGAAQVASRGGAVVGRVVETMRGINTTSQRIHDIIGVIDGIAFQTNILALNAAVEAARAGEQGRGFAVVASEVRSLAQRSAQAAKEIKGLITASVEHVEQGSSLVDNAGATMQEIVAAIQQVRELMDRLSRDSQTHAEGIDSVQRTVTRLDSATRDNAGLVEDSARSAASLHSEADQLIAAVACFKTGALAA